MTHLLYVWPVEKQLFGLWDWQDWYYPIFPMMNFPRGSPWLFTYPLVNYQFAIENGHLLDFPIKNGDFP